MHAKLKRSLIGNRHLLIVSGAFFLLVYLSSFVPGYGYFIDEFYYIACANRPALGYVDHPPLAPLLLTVFQSLFGSSLAAIRFLPAIGGALTVFLTGRLTRRMGGGAAAQTIASMSVACSPVIVGMAGFYSMNAFEPALALLLLGTIIRLIQDNRPHLWLAAGALMGLGVLNKHTFVVFIAFMLASIAISGRWRCMVDRWFVIGGLLALAVFLPNMIWQISNGFPSIEFYRNITLHKNVSTTPLQFILAQLMSMTPLVFLMAASGAALFLGDRSLRTYRFVGWLYLGLFVFFLLSGTSRVDRLAFAYPPALCGGGLLIEKLSRRRRWRWAPAAVTVLLFVGLLAGIPIVLPCLAPDAVAAHTRRIGLDTEVERGKKPLLPQLLADRIGWEDKVALVVRAYQGLAPAERSRAIVYAGNYGQAGALELLGRPHGITRVVCGHNTYYLWSRELLKRQAGGIVVCLTQARNEERLYEFFTEVAAAEGEFSSPYVSHHENDLRVFICRGLKLPPIQILERTRFYY
jgi:hypothetical protein